MDKHNVVYPYDGIIFDHKKMNEVLTNTTTWMNFENILLSERNHSPKTIYFIIPIIRTGEFHGQRSLVGYSPQDHKESDMTEAT